MGITEIEELQAEAESNRLLFLLALSAIIRARKDEADRLRAIADGIDEASINMIRESLHVKESILSASNKMTRIKSKRGLEDAAAVFDTIDWGYSANEYEGN